VPGPVLGLVDGLAEHRLLFGCGLALAWAGSEWEGYEAEGLLRRRDFDARRSAVRVKTSSV
jgi:hypothetical protein